MKNNGFTLIELAIVVVVLGILITGIVGGRSLIESSKRHKVVTDFGNLETGLNAFKLEYGQLPGDFEEAYDYWGSDCDPDHNPTYPNCIGNGDGKIGSAHAAVSLGLGGRRESRCVFKQLELAEIIKGGYGCDWSVPWIESKLAMKSPIDEGYYDIRYREIYGGLRKGNAINLTRITPGYASYTNLWFLSPDFAKAIDEKIDDGKMGGGKLISAGAGACAKPIPGQGGVNYYTRPRGVLEYNVGYTGTHNCFISYFID